MDISKRILLATFDSAVDEFVVISMFLSKLQTFVIKTDLHNKRLTTAAKILGINCSDYIFFRVVLAELSEENETSGNRERATKYR